MTKVNTNKEKIVELLSRGVEKIYPSTEKLEKKLLAGERLRLYCGFDPSAKSLHIGNAILINKLAQFQDLGHEVIFLIGDFTGMIGDPTDKTATRKKLSRKEVLANSASYQKQASAYLHFAGDNPADIRYNSEWSDKLSFRDLIEVSSNFTVQQMIQRDMFQTRLKESKPIYLHEFLYPLAQGYDSVAMDVDLEIGGNDQMFNMMCGRDLMRAMRKKEKFVMTLKLLADEQGKKMGKTEGNAVFLDQDASNMYGIIMSWPDGLIGIAFELCTKATMDEVKNIYGHLQDESVNPRDLKMKLAKEIVVLIHGMEKAQEAENNFINTIQKKEVPKDIETKKINQDKINILDLLFVTGLSTSKGEARRLIKQGGIKVDGEVLGDDKMELHLSVKAITIQRGKLRFIKVIK